MTLHGGIAWLSSSSAEIARARDVLKALKPGGVLDELGFLVLFGAFADRLYPATNTVMTRARYLVFVPAIYKSWKKVEGRQERTLTVSPETFSSSCQRLCSRMKPM
jgi:hypothetical protein